MKSEQSITELETSFHYHVLLDPASPFPEEKEEEKTIDTVEEELNTFDLIEHCIYLDYDMVTSFFSLKF